MAGRRGSTPAPTFGRPPAGPSAIFDSGMMVCSLATIWLMTTVVTLIRMMAMTTNTAWTARDVTNGSTFWTHGNCQKPTAGSTGSGSPATPAAPGRPGWLGGDMGGDAMPLT